MCHLLKDLKYDILPKKKIYQYSTLTYGSEFSDYKNQLIMFNCFRVVVYLFFTKLLG